MLVKVLGIVDLIVMLSLLLSAVLPVEWLMGVALYLLVKGGIFLFGGDVMSLVDIGIASYMLFVAYGISSAVITALAALFLLQKGVFSLLN